MKEPSPEATSELCEDGHACCEPSIALWAPGKPGSMSHAVLMSEADQLLRRSAILRSRGRQEFLPRIWEVHSINLLFSEASGARQRNHSLTETATRGSWAWGL